MNDREKLIELTSEAFSKCIKTNCTECVFLEQETPLLDRACQYRLFSDHLLANGVTVQRWIPVTERLPDSERIVLVSALTKTFRHRHTLMAAHIGHHEFTTEDTDWREYEGGTEYDEENDCFWIPECWYEVNTIDDNGNWIIDSEYDVTHWMPLPEPPKEDAE